MLHTRDLYETRARTIRSQTAIDLVGQILARLSWLWPIGQRQAMRPEITDCQNTGISVSKT